MNTELVYSIEGIFTTCLATHATESFYIAPYQRGYKWGADKSTDAVPILLNDLKEAFRKSQSNKSKEYYLQYITVKENRFKGTKVLEVIDGQQRLTTISILISVFHALGVGENIAKGRLVYELRDNFLQKHIYDAGKLSELLSLSWNRQEGINIDAEKVNEQDVYYMFHAAKRVYSFLQEYNAEERVHFYEYLLEYVKVIVNVVEPTVNSEKVFANLNGTKIYLTNAELVKGLLLTKTAREKDEQFEKRHFKEILEQRASMGRQWDELSRMANNPAFRAFFFDTTKSGIEHLLTLVAAIIDDYSFNSVKGGKYHLFNHFHSKISSGCEGRTALSYFGRVKEVAAVLNDWYYHDTEIYNLLGFLFFIKKSPYEQLDKKMTLLKGLMGKRKTDVKVELKEKRKELLEDLDIEKLSKEDDNEIHRVFLALSVFDKIKPSLAQDEADENRWVKFDFYKFVTESWDVEHVFPSNPKQVPNILDVDDILNIKELFDFKQQNYAWEKFKEPDETNEEQTKSAYESICLLIEKGKGGAISERQQKIIAKAISLLDVKDSIGNLCLLSAHINRSIGNGMFKAKRKKIIEKISDGHFVPIHTYKVFSKLLSPKMENTLRVWTRQDMTEHKSVIKEKVASIISDK